MNDTRSVMKACSDEQLMEHIAHGQDAALNELYARYNKAMMYYFYRMLGQEREKAQDFLQDLFLKIIEKPERFDTRRKLSTWLYTVAHNMCKNEYRKQEVRKVMQRDSNIEVDNGHRPDSDLHSKMFTEALYRELDQLDEARKTAFLLKYREGFTIEEISKVIDCSEGTVKSRLFYTNKRLSERLNAYHPNNTRP